jgi:hypothetical protein
MEPRNPETLWGALYVPDQFVWSGCHLHLLIGFDRYIGQTPIKNLHIPRSKILIGEYGGFSAEFDQYIDRNPIKCF